MARLVQIEGATCERCGPIEAQEFNGPWHFYEDGRWELAPAALKCITYPLICTEELVREEMYHGCAVPAPRVQLTDPSYVTEGAH